MSKKFKDMLLGIEEEKEAFDILSNDRITAEQTNLVREEYNLNLNLSDGDYDVLVLKTAELQITTNKYYTKIGRILKDIHKLLSSYDQGTWMAYLNNINFNYKRAMRLIDRYKFIMDNIDKIEYLEMLPVSLMYEVSKPSCDGELLKMVLNGEIKTLKDFNDLKETKTINYEDSAKKIEIDNIFKEKFKNFKRLNKLKIDVDKLSISEKKEFNRAIEIVENILSKHKEEEKL